MYTRIYEDSDYQKLCDWLQAIDWPPIPKESIPPYCIFIVDGDKDVAITAIYAKEKEYDFLYPSWIVLNPDTPYKEVLSVMDFIAKTYEDMARKDKKSHIMITMQTESIVNYLCRKHDYHRAEKNVTRLIKYLDKQSSNDGIFWYDQEGIDKHFPNSKFATPKNNDN